MQQNPPSYPPHQPPTGPPSGPPSGPPGGMPPGPPPSGKRPVVPIVAGLVVVVALVVGGAALLLSGDDDGSTAETGGGGAGAGAGAAGTAASLTGTWEGTFDCGGETGLTLTIDDPGGGTLGANFAIHPPEGAIDADTTRYSMEGTSADGQLTLTGSEWILPEEPGADDVMVDLEADLTDRGNSEHLEGTAVGGGCSGFSVDRVSTEPWYAGVWEGAYGCSQGVTGLRMTIEPERRGVVEAVYEFYALAENPDVPSGSYRMEGTYDDARELSLNGVEWIEQPRNYGMVDLLFFAELGVDPQRLYGAITDLGDACNVFTLSRPEGGAEGESGEQPDGESGEQPEGQSDGQSEG
jgi:hypothetical protein